MEKGIPQADSEKEKYEQNEHPLSIPANGNEKKATILIVEDNADMRTYICSILKNKYQLKEAQNGAEAVSYTHLDVYKRQVPGSPRKLSLTYEVRSLGILSPWSISFPLISMMTVSYTHLDVYKRQKLSNYPGKFSPLPAKKISTMRD